MSKPSKQEWVILNPAHDGGRLECLRCGDAYLPNYPIPISLMVALTNAFTKQHRGCALGVEGLRCHYCCKPGHGPLDCPTLKVTTPEAWWSGPDTGTSSKTMWCVMMHVSFSRLAPCGPSDPMDPADFGRCYRLLKLFPEWRVRIGEMAMVDGWRGLAGAWGELEALYEEELPSGEAPKLYRRMKELGA